MVKPFHMNNELIYVYCILANNPQLGKIEGYDDLEVFCGDDYYAVTKLVQADEYSEENQKKNFSNFSWIEAQVRNHIEVISLIMKNNTVIPCKFGTIFKSEASLKEFLCSYSLALLENLDFVEGKEEWAVKVFSNPEFVSEKVSMDSEAIRSLEQQIKVSSPGKSFLLKKRRTDLIEQEVERFCNNHAQECFDILKSNCELHEINKLLPKNLSGNEGEMILNASFFIKKQMVNRFVNAAHSLKKDYLSMGFELEFTGPWPPFSFISINNSNAGKCN